VTDTESNFDILDKLSSPLASVVGQIYIK